MISNTPAIDMIIALESYNDSHISASSSLKAAVWDINKARRQRGRHIMTVGHAFSALDVREELRAQVGVNCDAEEPTLCDESEGGKSATISDIFKLCHHSISTEDKGGDSTITQNPTYGVRHRKKGSPSSNGEKNENKWSEEAVVDKEEEMLRNTDPLDLFGGGLVPRDLKNAQKHARESLASYIAAANKVAEIMQIINSTQKNGDD
mmetsp:Transcript_25343/g.37897  ORF Transcript_25343/g.37897 Transcript_25343/m.37897 type:complete len:207 (+) Transcript_25343:65-685(+)